MAVSKLRSFLLLNLDTCINREFVSSHLETLTLDSVPGAHPLSFSQSPTRSKGFGTERVNVKAIEMLGGGEEGRNQWQAGGGDAAVVALCTENSSPLAKLPLLSSL